MTDPTPAQKIRNLCDTISELVEATHSPTTIASYGGTEGTGSRTVKYPMSDAIMDAREELKATLVSWALLIVEESGVEFDGRDDTTSITAWIYQQADWLGSHFAADDFLIEAGEAAQKLAELLDRKVSSKKFIGWDQGQPVFAHGDKHLGVPAVHAIARGRDELRDMLRNEDMTVKDCADALTLFLDHPPSARQILKLYEVDRRRRERGSIGEHEGLSPVRFEETGKRTQPIFRVSEVLTRVESSRRVSGQAAG